MVYQPQTEDSLYISLRDRLQGKIPSLTNFVPTSFNYVWTRAFAERVRANEVALLANQLSGYIEYAGGPITQDDLDTLGVSEVSAEEVNEYMRDEDLDELVAILGLSRDEGDRADGTVTITTSSSSVTVPEATQFGTQPDSQGNSLVYETTEEVTAGTGTTSVTANVQATEVGQVYNVGSGEVTFLINPPTGVKSVTNNDAIDGGVGAETNDELRERAKQAVFTQSGGGTVRGIEGFIFENVDGVTSVNIEQFKDGGPKQPSPYADVIVDGGIDSEVQDAIETSRPSAIRHFLVRPTFVTLDVTATVTGTDIDVTAVEDSVNQYISPLGVSESVVRDKIIQIIMNSDRDIERIEQLDIEVIDEPITFSTGTDVYGIDKQMQNDGITEVTGTLSGTSGHTFVEDTDYQESDTDGDGLDDSIDWSLSGDTPDDGTDFFVDYLVEDDIAIGSREKAEPRNVDVTVV